MASVLLGRYSLHATSNAAREPPRTTAPSLCGARRASSRDRSRTAIAKPRTSLGFPTALLCCRRDVVKVPARCGDPDWPRPLLVERPLPICKVVYGPPSMQCLPARFAIEAPACHDRPPYLDSAVKRPAEQATKKDAHWSSVPGRSAPRALGQLGRHSQKGKFVSWQFRPNICEFAPTWILGRDAARWAQGAVSAHSSQRTKGPAGPGPIARHSRR
ncbi:hypothetical protein ABIF64_008794 [Bradyrhizobium japonicum]|nr:hypothetical protein [Bradyrhizobium japonicum]MCP1785506.1 hypothetical protein [Bradyrhizobium japonicum]MCP1807385.1 hypothetical protein [Bradyrhizobium japonicum]MCP1816312.1 hypothetical protein [Bradyrhizobium japonicum]MCP1872175.1 hypothetical protein [Bradyrhizobium japonicum]